MYWSCSVRHLKQRKVKLVGSCGWFTVSAQRNVRGFSFPSLLQAVKNAIATDGTSLLDTAICSGDITLLERVIEIMGKEVRSPYPSSFSVILNMLSANRLPICHSCCRGTNLKGVVVGLLECNEIRWRRRRDSSRGRQ